MKKLASLLCLIICTLLLITGCKGDGKDKNHEHSFSEWITMSQPDCVNEGKRQRQCQCGTFEYETLDATGIHKFSDWITVTEPTCAEEGSHFRLCSCGFTETADIPATEKHNFSVWETIKTPTCVIDGRKISICECGKIATEDIPATGEHNYNNSFIVKNPTCVNEGELQEVCKCGDARISVLPATGEHTYEDWIIDHDAKIRYSFCENCGERGEAPLTSSLPYADGTTLRMATGYNRNNTGLFFHPDQFDFSGYITLADGNTYYPGDLKPTWVEVQNILKITFEDRFTGAGASEREFLVWKEKLDEVDLVSGSHSVISEAGARGDLINLADYLHLMPNFKKFLDDNPIVRLSISSLDLNGGFGTLYLAPYFDGFSDIERMPLMRADWVIKLLDGEGDFSATYSNPVRTAVYTPYMPTSGKIEIDVVKLDASGTERVTKNYDAAGNIIANMNAAGSIDGVQAVNMLRKYIDEAYGGYYGTTRSNLFIGQNAAWDADELVALLRCVVANPQTLNGTDSVQGIFTREDGNNQRRVDMFRLAGVLFGVRGLESRQDYLYVGADGFLHDARQEEATYVALERMNALVQEGLLSESFIQQDSNINAQRMLQNDTGFMHFDYNQTQTIHNAYSLDEGEKYMAAMIPVARWFDGTDPNGVYMRFTESWRSVKTDGWAISKAGIAQDENKLYAALALIDFAYSERGQILLSYGPDAFIKTYADGSYVTFDYNGKTMPVISDDTFTEVWDKSNGNYTNYARQYLGSTIGFVKSQAFEYQCTHEVGKEGAAKISNAIKYGTIKHPELAVTENPWYTTVPTILPNTRDEIDILYGFTELNSNGSFAQSKNKTNVFVDIIIGGYDVLGCNNANEFISRVEKDWGGNVYLELKQIAFARALELFK